MARSSLPGVRVGPLDPDATESFGQVSGRSSARQLIRTHSAMHPPQLVRSLSLKLDEERTAALLLTEVSDVLRADGDLLPEGAVVEGAQVRGERDRPQLVTFTYRVESGRTAKGFTEYDDRFETSVQRGDEAVRIADLRKTGFPLTGEGYEQDRHIGSARAESAERHVAALRAENDELRKRLEAQGQAEGGGKSAEQERQGGEDDGDDDDSKDASGAEEPVDGYSEFNADKAKGAIKEADEPTVQAILAYEREVGKRSTVVSAAEHRLDELAKAHQKPDNGE